MVTTITKWQYAATVGTDDKYCLITTYTHHDYIHYIFWSEVIQKQ